MKTGSAQAPKLPWMRKAMPGRRRNLSPAPGQGRSKEESRMPNSTPGMPRGQHWTRKVALSGELLGVDRGAPLSGVWALEPTLPFHDSLWARALAPDSWWKHSTLGLDNWRKLYYSNDKDISLYISKHYTRRKEVKEEIGNHGRRPFPGMHGQGGPW